MPLSRWTQSLVVVCAAAVASMLLAGCGPTPAPIPTPTPAPTPAPTPQQEAWCDTTSAQRAEIRESVRATLESKGYVAKVGVFKCDDIANANAGNPESNTCYFLVGSTDTSRVYQLNTSDVLVYVACAPAKPGPLYFGISAYLLGFNAENVPAQIPKGQMVDSLNQLVMNSTAEASEGGGSSHWGSSMAVVFSADQVSTIDATTALQEAEFPRAAINTMVVPSDLLSMGYGSEYNYFLTAARVGPFVDEEQRKFHLDHSEEPVLLLRAESRSTPADPFQTPKRRNRTDDRDAREDVGLALEDLTSNISDWAALHGWQVVETLSMTPLLRDGVVSNGTECITNLSTTGCWGDSDDAAYQVTGRVSSLPDDGMDIIIGVNNARIGMAVYGSTAFYMLPPDGSQASVFGGSAMNSNQYVGSAARFVPENSASTMENLYAVDFTPGKCEASAKWCINATTTSPHILTYLDRAYLNPATGTGPDVHQMFPPILIRLQRTASEYQV